MQNYVNLCSQVRCHNGGSCSQTATSWTCHCQPGWYGRYCDVPNQSCQDFAARKGEEVFFLAEISRVIMTYCLYYCKENLKY